MEPVNGESGLTKQQSDAYTVSLALWANPSTFNLPLPRMIDQVLTDSDYVFYHEPEWARYGYRPPENHPLHGAWRDGKGTVFAFLLKPLPVDSELIGQQFLLYVSGDRDAVDELSTRVTALKSELAKMERKELQIQRTEQKITQEQESPAVPRLTKMIFIFTGVINAFSLYLRRLPTPTMPSTTMTLVFQYVVGAIHIASLVSLLIITLVGIAYVLRYGILVLRRF
jgi:hypothetical protein